MDILITLSIPRNKRSNWLNSRAFCLKLGQKNPTKDRNQAATKTEMVPHIDSVQESDPKKPSGKKKIQGIFTRCGKLRKKDFYFLKHFSREKREKNCSLTQQNDQLSIYKDQPICFNCEKRPNTKLALDSKEIYPLKSTN